MNPLVPYRNGRRFGTLLSLDPVRLFDDLARFEPPGAETVWSPYAQPVKIDKDDGGATISVDMPGVDAADLEISFERGTLTIAGKRGDHAYRFAVAVGETIDPDNIEAELDKGVLTVRAHARADAKPRKIAVKAK